MVVRNGVFFKLQSSVLIMNKFSLKKKRKQLYWDNKVNDAFRPFERAVYRFWRPKSFISVISQQKIRWSSDQWFYSASNYFEIAWNINLRTGKTMRQRSRSERKNCQRMCFVSSNYVTDHASIRFFFDINSLHCFMWFFCTTCCFL